MKKKLNRPRVLLALEWYSHEIHRGIAKFAKEANWILDTQIRHGISPPFSWQGDGVICMLSAQGKLLQIIKNISVPTVNIAWRDCPLDTPMVLHDDLAIGKMAAEEFIANGFKNLAFYRSENRTVAHDRMQGFKMAAEKAGLNYISLDLCQLKTRSINNPSQRQKWLMKNLQKIKKPIGIFTQNDDHAIEVLYACESIEISVPQEVAIIGCDNDELLCSVSSVPLSSIDSNQFELGFQAAKRLDNIIRKKRKYSRPLLIKPGQIFIRKSSDITAVTDPDVASALEYIIENAKNMITVNDVVSACNVSRRQLYLAFENELGHGIAKEITFRRIKIAEKLITQGKFKLYQVAKNSGFASLQHMRNTFIRHTKLPPSKILKVNKSSSTAY